MKRTTTTAEKSTNKSQKIDSSIVARRSLLPSIRGYYPSSADFSQQRCFTAAYPRASIYYACNADADPSRRVTDFIGNCSTAASAPTSLHDAYSEEEARTRYLGAKPTCYIVLGKPGLETERLAELIADERNCVLISASKFSRQLELDELSKKNDEDCGCVAREEEVWHRVVGETYKRSVAHRGYVLEGLPLLQLPKKSQQQQSASCEFSESTSDTVKPQGDFVVVELRNCVAFGEDMCKPHDSEESIGSTSSSVSSKSGGSSQPMCLSGVNTESIKLSSSEPSLQSSDTCTCTEESSDLTQCSEYSVFYQMHNVFSNWHLKPDLIVNVTCPDDEILAKYRACSTDSASSVENIDCQSDLSVVSSAVKSSSEPAFVETLERLLRVYESEVVEKFVVAHYPQNVICIDGRYPIEHIFETVKIRLQVLPLQVTIVPERMIPEVESRFKDSLDASTESEWLEDYESFGNSEDSDDLRRSFAELRRNGVPSDEFQWQLSRWKFLCPVELAKGRKTEGRKKFAVRFLRWIFFLSSSEAAEVFVDNPRTFLTPPNPRPCCRIAVMGPRYSGKTKLSFDLAREFDSVVVNVREVSERFSRNFDDNYDPPEASSSHESVNARIVEIVNGVAEIIENSPEQDCGCYNRNRGWILDELSLDYNACKVFLENDVNIDTVVILFESDPYSDLIKNWQNMHEQGSSVNEHEYLCESEIESHEELSSDFGEPPPNIDLLNYIKELELFENSRKYVASQLADLGIEVILCDLKFISDRLEHVVCEIRKEYDYEPEIVEDNEDEGEEEEEEEYESDSNLSIRKKQESNHAVGDCDVYCPVSLVNDGILWKGKTELKCLLAEKLYFMSSQAALDDFMANYPRLKVPFEKPLPIPPARVFLVGPPGSGKSTLANLISREIGLAHVDFFKSVDQYMSSRGIDVEALNSLVNSANADDDASSESSFEEYELPENLDDQMYLMDKPTIINFFSKYKKEGALLPIFMAKECLTDYFKPPFSECGLILDSFPNCLEDCETMLKYSTVPDLVIELRCDFADSEKRLLDNLVTQWNAEQERKREEEESKYSQSMDEYLYNKEKWMRVELMKRYREKKGAPESQEDTDGSEGSSSSTSFSDVTDWTSVLSIDDEIEIEDEYHKLYPQPEPFDAWEDEETATEKFCLQIEENYDKTMQNLSIVSSFFENENIPWLQVDARQDVQRVFVKILRILAPYNTRNSSFLEQVQQIDNLTAEYLLSTGFYFLSSFGRFCPVQLYERKNLFQMFVPLASVDQIFAVTHRQFVYFLAGEAALAEFKRHPLKYLNQDPRVPMIPAKISIIGPPKCGKTTVGRRFASTYGFELITRDEAIDYALTNFQTSNLSVGMKCKLQNGETLTPLQIARAVKLFLSNPQCVTQGCVLDGFPASVEESRAFVALAINPTIVIDLEAPLDFTLECFEDDESYGYLTESHIQAYEDWTADAEVFRGWLSDNFGNVARVDATRSKAYVWRRAEEDARRRFAAFATYVREVDNDKVHDLEYLCVTPHEVEDRLGPFKLYCPSCIYFHGIYDKVDLAKSRKGLVQYRDNFFWFCEKHMELFKLNPSESLQLFDKVKLPEHYPLIIKDIVDLDNRCWLTKLVNKGYCLISYVENLPYRKLVPGKPSLAVLYQHQLYLFCSESCREKFARKFLNYSAVQIHFPQKLPPMDVKALPCVGYLEQTFAALLAKAVTRVAELRPKLLDLSPSASAAVYIGAFLKAHGGCPLERNLYLKALEKMERRCSISKLVIEDMKKRINPWLHWRGDEVEPVESDKSEDTKEPTEFDYMTEMTVKFRRTSSSQILVDADDSSIGHSGL